jgi:SRSO17 transposase
MITDFSWNFSFQPFVAAGQRWIVKDGCETAGNEPGRDHNETRSWHGWHCRVSPVMPAFVMLATIRYRANHRHPQTHCCRRPRGEVDLIG